VHASGWTDNKDQRDLERAMETFADAREAEVKPRVRGNDSSSRLD
jgi:hypothetical protein